MLLLCPTTVVARQNNDASNTLTLSRTHGQIYRTKNESEPALRRPDFRLLQGIGTEELSAGHAWPERFPAQTIRVCDRARRKAAAALSVWASRAAISEHLR